MLLGLAGGVVCYSMTQLIKQRLKIDDSLDVFAVHGIGGALGSLLVAFFVAAALGGRGLADGMTMGSQLGVQAFGIVLVAIWSGVLTFIIVKVLKMFCKFRVDEETEVQGLDLAMHGERGYHGM
jgi:Amt family ammonium transporter